jgi:hypothetical protein
MEKEKINIIGSANIGMSTSSALKIAEMANEINIHTPFQYQKDSYEFKINDYGIQDPFYVDSTNIPGERKKLPIKKKKKIRKKNKQSKNSRRKNR